MSRIIQTVDRWGPGVVAIITLLVVIALGWYQSERVARLEGVVLEQRAENQQRGMDVQTWQAYVISLQKVMIESGLSVPDAPKPRFVHANTDANTNTNANRKRR